MKILSRFPMLLSLVLLVSAIPADASMEEQRQKTLSQALIDNDYSPSIKSLAERFEDKLNSADFAGLPEDEKRSLRQDLISLFLYTCETESPDAMNQSPFANVKFEEVDLINGRISEILQRRNLYSSPYFYELRREDGKLIYLIGAQHTTPLGYLVPKVKEVMDSCHKVWFEIDFSREKTKSDFEWLYGQYEEKGLAKTPQSDWIEFVKPDAAAIIKKFTDDCQAIYGVDYRNIHPCFYMTRDSLDLRDQDSGMDMTIYNSFHAASKPMRHLETGEERINIDGAYFERISDYANVNRSMIPLGMNLSQYVNKCTNSMRRAAHYLFDFVYALDLFSPDEFYQIGASPSIDLRNKLWMGSLDKELEGDQFNEPNLMCVGLGHLAGPAGLLPYFSDKGFSIKRMDAKGEFSIKWSKPLEADDSSQGH